MKLKWQRRIFLLNNMLKCLWRSLVFTALLPGSYCPSRCPSSTFSFHWTLPSTLDTPALISCTNNNKSDTDQASLGLIGIPDNLIEIKLNVNWVIKLKTLFLSSQTKPSVPVKGVVCPVMFGRLIAKLSCLCLWFWCEAVGERRHYVVSRLHKITQISLFTDRQFTVWCLFH